MDFHENLYRGVSRKSVVQFKICLKSDKNFGHFTWRPKYFYCYRLQNHHKSLLTAKCSATTPSNTLLNFHGIVLSIDGIVMWLNNTQNSLLRCRGNSGYANTSQCHVIRPLHILLWSMSILSSTLHVGIPNILMYLYSELKFRMLVNVALPVYVFYISFPYFSFIYLIIVVVFGAEYKLCNYTKKKKKTIVYFLSCVGLKLSQFTQLLEPRGSAVPRFLISCQTYFFIKFVRLYWQFRITSR